MKISILTFLSVLFFSTSNIAYADVKLESYFGFTTTLEDGWFVLNPNTVAAINSGETLESLGVSDKPDKEVLNSIMEDIKSGNVEFFYDKKYFNEDFKNNISIQLAAPQVFESVEHLQSVMKEQCGTITKDLQDILNEEPIVHSCNVLPSNGFAVLHHAYTIPSQNVVIINENVVINSKFSMIFAGGGISDGEGIKRLRKAQETIVHSFTEFLKSQQK